MAELLVKQLHRWARELGEDVPVDMSAEPGEAAGERRVRGGSGVAAPSPCRPCWGKEADGRAGGKDLTLALCSSGLLISSRQNPWRATLGPPSQMARLQLSSKTSKCLQVTKRDTRLNLWPQGSLLVPHSPPPSPEGLSDS